MAKYKIYGLNVYSEIELPSTFQLSDDSETEAEIVRADLTEEYGKAEAYKETQVQVSVDKEAGMDDADACQRVQSLICLFGGLVQNNPGQEN